MRAGVLALGLVVAVAGCGESNGGGAGAGGESDAALYDAALHDAALSDAALHDAALHDAALSDADTMLDATPHFDSGTDAELGDAAAEDAFVASDASVLLDASEDVDAFVGSDASVLLDAFMDVDECADDNGGCDLLSTCTDTIDSVICGACPSGYGGSGELGCTDINECDDDNGGCDLLTTCTNTAGSRTCSPCPSGYLGSGDAGCFMASGSTCLAILAADNDAVSGIYTISPNGIEPVAAYCDMTTDGGGWTKILQYHDVSYIPTADAVGDIATTDTPAFAKLADAQINAFGSMPTYRLSGSRTTKSVYITTDAPFSDPSVGFGLMNAAPTRICESDSYETCNFTTTDQSYIDTLHWGLVGNDTDRYFADYSGDNVNCYNPGQSGVRCMNAGNSVGHAFIADFSMWVRESGLLAHWTLDEGAGATFGDSSGNARTMTNHLGTWTTGVIDGGYSGTASSDAALPDLERVTVSIWAQRDGNGQAYPRIFGWSDDRLEIADFASSGKLGIYTPGIGWEDTGAALPNGTYVHIAVTIGAGVALVYVDGAVVATYQANIALRGQAFVGTRGSPLNSEVFNGSVDQVRIYNRALSANEVALLAAE